VSGDDENSGTRWGVERVR